VLELSERYSVAELAAYFESILDHSERLTRMAIDQLPEGEYEAVDYLDNDGVDFDQPVRIQVKCAIDAGMFKFDFAGSNAQIRGPFNCVPAGVYAAACFALKSFVDPKGEIPINGGCFRAISLTLPDNSVVNPSADAAIGCRASTIKRIASTMLSALRLAAPDRVPADHASVELLIHFGGKNRRGEKFVTSQILVGGSGAAADRDGVDAIESDTTNCMNIPVEAFEMEAPIRVSRLALLPDSGGAGHHRGGLGLDVEYEFLGDGVTMTFRGERHVVPAKGLQGGKAGALSSAKVLHESGNETEIRSKAVLSLHKGDRLLVQTSGGGGFGDPSRRGEEDRMNDRLDRKIS
jgi:N-methylhydantoinase B